MRLPYTPEVLIMGHPLLFKSQPTVAIDEILTDDFQHNLDVLKTRQIDSQGIGIAAPQIGWPAKVLSLGITKENHFRYPGAPDIPFSFWINPQITHLSPETCWTWEGCLSVPGIRAWVERPSAITVAGYGSDGERKELTIDGFFARVMQHELDHLNGKLFLTRVESKELLIPDAAIEHQAEWADGWPTENARNTLRGQISEHR